MSTTTGDPEEPLAAGAARRREPQVELSVVIPAHQAEATIGAQLDALLDQQWAGPWEVVVVDNGSTDGTAAIVSERQLHDDRVRLVRDARGAGAAFARNAGVRAARGWALAFCDADDVVGPCWVSAMAEGLQRSCFVTGPLDVDLLNPPRVRESRGRSYLAGRYEFRGRFPMAPGANLGVRRDVFEQVGGFDETMSPVEDLDLSYRLWRAGVELIWSEDASVAYRYRTSDRQLFDQSRSYALATARFLRRADRDGVALPATPTWRRLGWLVRHAPIGKRADRARWMWVAGEEGGRFAAQLRARRGAPVDEEPRPWI